MSGPGRVSRSGYTEEGHAQVSQPGTAIAEHDEHWAGIFEEVSGRDWLYFLDQFTLRHREKKAIVEAAESRDERPKLEAQMVLEGVSLSGDPHARNPQITISLGETADRHIGHNIPSVTTLRIHRDTNGVEDGLEITSLTEGRTILRIM